MPDNKMTKSAGEHWVCSILSRLGWAAALTRDGIERTDILAANSDGRHLSIQVKTTTTFRSPRFRTGSKCCTPSVSPGEWFVFVALSPDALQLPRAFVVPRDHVAAAVWIEHMEWLTNPNIKPGVRNTGIDQAMTSAKVFARYEQRWDLLGMSSTEVPVLLPPRFRTLAQTERVLLPDGHPWRLVLPEWERSESHETWSEWESTES